MREERATAIRWHMSTDIKYRMKNKYFEIPLDTLSPEIQQAIKDRYNIRTLTGTRNVIEDQEKGYLVPVCGSYNEVGIG